MEDAISFVNVENFSGRSKPHIAETPFPSLLRPAQRRKLTIALLRPEHFKLCFRRIDVTERNSKPFNVPC